ncbi:hypothetical protein HMPREF9065_01739 [Aggregatibacter sp. oral taxon 458 str. W10330]|nr:hypothetical protein HMPREF9065_01739 [Aggregatibacter sp. oral taxon 458 str. W10330]
MACQNGELNQLKVRWEFLLFLIILFMSKQKNSTAFYAKKYF